MSHHDTLRLWGSSRNQGSKTKAQEFLRAKNLGCYKTLLSMSYNSYLNLNIATIGFFLYNETINLWILTFTSKGKNQERAHSTLQNIFHQVLKSWIF